MMHTQQRQLDSQTHLDSIFDSVKRQIDLWGENAKWKIDLVLLDNSNSNSVLLSPQQLLHVNTTPSSSLPITSAIQYPWDYEPPSTQDWRQSEHDDLQHKLKESIERQRYLENIIWSQAEQIKNKTQTGLKEETIQTMKNIFLMNEKEQKNRYKVETDLLEKDIQTLQKKLQKMASTLYAVEQIKVPADRTETEALVEDRKTLMRKLYLAELRLSARDVELEYLHEWVDSLKSSTFTKPIKKARKGPPYLLQQQFSPRSSGVRYLDHPPQPLTALDSLGIVADHMLSDPEFDSTQRRGEKRLRSGLNDRRSQRSMDSAVTLLTMPQWSSAHQNTSPTQPNKKSKTTYMRWTEEEDSQLRQAVHKHGSSNWEACSKELEGRSNIQCRNRWIRYLEAKEPKSNARQSPSIAALLNTCTSPSSITTTHKKH
ncbi:hypothetical protein BY458DRAFT_517992 [Sporodiniella umbellata]|nr:hypothetical protein BY458DRAFT_517992 [Sporodiniella umbellata]